MKKRVHRLIPDFRQRFMSLLSYDAFKKFDAATALSIVEAASPKRPRPSDDEEGAETATTKAISAEELNSLLTPFDMKRLQSYCDNMIEHHIIIDLVPVLSTLFFSRRLGAECTLSAAQQAILLALGLQRKPVEALETELGLTPSQVLALFSKIIRRIVKTLEDIRKLGAGRDLPVEEPEVKKNGLNGSSTWKPVEQSVEEELSNQPLDPETTAAREAEKEMFESVDMTQ